jgi:glycosyltransferase involved in cell wall biosynthesis
MKMRVAFNAQLIGDSNSGVEKYMLYLLAHLDALLSQSEHRMDVFVRGNQRCNWDHLNVERVGGPRRSRLYRIGWEQFVLPMKLSKAYDLAHAPGYIAPLLSRIPVVLTVHDLIALQHPRLCSRANALYYRLTLPQSIMKAARIIVPSKWVKSALLRQFNQPEEKVTVIYEGVSDRFRARPDDRLKARLTRQYQLTDRFILYVGNVEPKKNLPLLLRVFDRLKSKYRSLKLVICGRISWKSRPFWKAMKSLTHQKEVILTGYLSDEAVHALYCMAEAFVFPSLTEGFGVPPLEAMACGAPVITTDCGAVAEIAGAGAILIPPTDGHELEKALVRVLDSEALRMELKAKGLAQSAKYSWKQAAMKTLQVYKAALQQAS